MKPGKHIARKRFGQHFLADGGIIEAIVEAIDPRPGQAMVEIGPGLAALTQPLVERLGNLTVIELDRDLAERLRGHAQLQVIESDVLKVDVYKRQLLADASGLHHTQNAVAVSYTHLDVYKRQPSRRGKNPRPSLKMHHASGWRCRR